MYEVTFKNSNNQDYFNSILISNDKTHYISIYVGNDNDNVFVTIAKSDDGFNFKSPCKEADDLKIESKNSLEEVFDHIKNYFLNRGYQYTTMT